MNNFKSLNKKEIIEIKGGGLNPLITRSFWLGYIAAEVLEGIQRGLSADCSKTC